MNSNARASTSCSRYLSSARFRPSFGIHSTPGSRSRLCVRPPPERGSALSWPALRRLLAADLCRHCLGDHSQLASSSSAIQNLVFDVVRSAGVFLLSFPLDQQGSGAELGRTCLS